MFPFLYNSIEPGFFTDVSKSPVLHSHLMSEQFFVPLDLSLKVRISNGYKVKIGLSHTKTAGSYDFKTELYLLNVGFDREFFKKKQTACSFGADLVLGRLEYHDYFWTSGNHGIGTIDSARVVIGGVALGISIQHNLSRKFFLESETNLLVYFGDGYGKVIDYSKYPYMGETIKINILGVVFSKLFGIKIGYKI